MNTCHLVAQLLCFDSSRSETQPYPSRKPAAPPSARRGRIAGRSVDKPAAVTPSVPAGFTVSVYAELQAPRMMVYAPNGDLFVSSPAANNITVFRDANNDGVFEARSVFAQGEVARRGGGGARLPAAHARRPAAVHARPRR